jgi:hypothetical protein
VGPGNTAAVVGDLAVGDHVARHWACHTDDGRHAPCGGEMDVAASRLALTRNGQDGQAWWASVVGGKSRGRRSDSRARAWHVRSGCDGGCTTGIPSSRVVRVTAAAGGGREAGLEGSAVRLDPHTEPVWEAVRVLGGADAGEAVGGDTAAAVGVGSRWEEEGGGALQAQAAGGRAAHGGVDEGEVQEEGCGRAVSCCP